ncbi:hypothetical protein HK100_009265 [Physocladia obscura]|uniref:DUF3752 domain-containing protein n=1 Tax=Physocladia obscura TaxID=109957 RepID=A0AAD5T5Y6_9FUNG|nr:hypothetical protein HK100_009265 [Physocladia obscura]
MRIGPELPPGFVRPVANSVPDPDPETSVPVGPVMPPGFLRSDIINIEDTSCFNNTNNVNCEQPKRRRMMGPAAPLSAVTALNYVTASSNSDDNDDAIGPMPVPSEYAEHIEKLELERTRLEIEARTSGPSALAIDEGNDGSKKSEVRGNWMLVPPEAKKLNTILGTEMKSRQFARNAGKEEVIDQSDWTRLPNQHDEDSSSSTVASKRRKSDVETLKSKRTEPDVNSIAVDEYNKIYRPKSLMEMHTSQFVKSTKFAENDASNRRFDRDRDLGSRRTSAKARDDLINGGNRLESRFSK